MLVLINLTASNKVLEGRLFLPCGANSTDWRVSLATRPSWTFYRLQEAAQAAENRAADDFIIAAGRLVKVG